MSGLDGGAPSAAPAAGNDGTGGEDVRVQPGAPRTPQQASDALDDRIQQKRVMAERQSGLHTIDGKTVTPSAPGTAARGPDGKFLPRDGSQAAAATPSKAAAPVADPNVSPDDHDVVDAAAKDSSPEVERLKADHERTSRERDTLKERDSEWTQIAEKALARMDSQKAYIAQLEAALAERGGEVDPRDAEILRYREGDRARQLGEERAAYEAQRGQQEARDAQRAEARTHLTNSTKAALTAHPALLKSGPDLKEYLTLVYRGGDPTTLAEVFAQRAENRAGARAAPMAPRTLSGRGAGSGGPKLTDPRDIADKWKATLGANA